MWFPITGTAPNWQRFNNTQRHFSFLEKNADRNVLNLPRFNTGVLEQVTIAMTFNLRDMQYVQQA